MSFSLPRIRPSRTHPSRILSRPYGVRGRDSTFSRTLALAGPVLVCTLGLSLSVAAAAPIRLVAFGDSLTAGYMLSDTEGFVPRLEAALRAQGRDVTVVNAGVSGDTTSGGLARLDWSLGEGADAVILELGANDMLRGIDPKITRDNLSKMIASLKARKIKVLLAGIRALPSLGKDYADQFDPIFGDLARQYGVPLYPLFVDGIIGDASQHLMDGMHPNARGVNTMVGRILPSVDALLNKVGRKG